MSGNTGFSGGGVENDPGYSTYRNTGFGSAMGAYGAGSVRPDPPRSGARPPAGASAMAPPVAPLPKVDLGVRFLKFTAPNVVIIGLDTTGSMSTWPVEIFDRIGLLHNELVKILSGPVQIVFIGFGDIPECDDPFEVTPIGSGPELLGYLAVMKKSSNGGGNMVESSDLVLAFANSMVDVACAKHVFTFVITDEMVRDHVDVGYTGPWKNDRGQVVAAEPVASVVRSLKVRQDVFAIIKPYGTVPDLRDGDDPMALFNNPTTREVIECWTGLLGREWVAPLPDRRRVVDVILGCIAKRIGKGAEFDAALVSRQASTSHGYGTINIKTVRASIASIGGTVLKPLTRSRALLPPGGDPAPAAIEAEVVAETPALPPVTRSSRLLPP